MVSTSPSPITTPLPARSVPSVSAVKASGAMMECRPTTAASARSRSNPKSSARGWIAGGTFHSVNEGIEVLRFPAIFYHRGAEREMTPDARFDNLQSSAFDIGCIDRWGTDANGHRTGANLPHRGHRGK